MLSVDEPEPVTEVGAKVAAAPEGKPVALNVMAPEKLFSPVTAALNDVAAP